MQLAWSAGDLAPFERVTGADPLLISYCYFRTRQFDSMRFMDSGSVQVGEHPPFHLATWTYRKQLSVLCCGSYHFPHIFFLDLFFKKKKLVVSLPWAPTWPDESAWYRKIFYYEL